MSLERYERLAQDLVSAYNTGNVDALRRIVDHYELQEPQGGLWSRTVDELRAGIRHRLRRKRLASLSVTDARRVVAGEEDFESWADLVRHLAAIASPDSPVRQFESAVDAVITGNVATLERLLRDQPDLGRARSTRKHGATLLHYVAANGIESYRQKTPKNAVTIAKLLLAAGAEVDADLAYGTGQMRKRYPKRAGSTTLGLVATSVHPAVAGVQIALLETLLEAGASVDAPWDKSVVRAALANGRGEAAEFLAGRGAAMDLEAAAGVGRLDVVKQFFNADGSLNGKATTEQLMAGFAWACEYGHTQVVDFLLQHGVTVDASLKHNGQTGLHWAAYGAHLDTARLLLEHHAPVDIKDRSFGGTPLEWALYGWVEGPPEAERDRYHEVVKLLVAAGGTADRQWLEDPDRGYPIIDRVNADPRMRAALAWPT
jgi:ankyrin repeat protein